MTTPPITADTRVSDALARRPELRDVLSAFHPAFARLHHPVLGRVLPRLVTVADAARIAGVDVDALVGVMNCPVGPPAASGPGAAGPGAAASDPSGAAPFAPGAAPRHAHPSGPRTPATPPPAWFDAARVTTLDARPVLDAGEDPLSHILAAVRRLPAGGQLTVLAPFEPIPLVGLLARQGWSAWTRWEGDTCHVTFARGSRPAAPADASAAAPAAATAGAPASRAVATASGWSLDVRALPPPEPMQQVLAAVDAGHLPLTVLHAREPALLYPHLAQRGLAWAVSTTEEGVLIEVRRA